MIRAQQLRNVLPQLIAELKLYTPETGGRKTPAMLGWGCPCCLSKSPPITGYDGWPLFGDAPLIPGEQRKLGFVFLSGEEAAAMFRKAGKFYLWERGFIGEAIVINQTKQWTPA